MNDQLTLLHPSGDLQAGRALRDAAIAQADEHAEVEWKLLAERALWAVIQAGEPFTTDDVWERIDVPHEPRALGAVMQSAARANLIHKTGDYRQSRRPECHARPVAVWAVGSCIS
jgi:hypothetical protein